MCGIVGILEPGERRARRDQRVGELLEMIARIGHRGPDQAGYVVDDHAALGAVRLSINDLERGHQPMDDGARRHWIVFNGEIYNHEELRAELEGLGHRFATRCDTEVALRAWIQWGEAAPERFEGGYAFALYDRQRRAMWLVRDRYGKRPLFYAEHGGALIFASEVKALTAVGGFKLSWDPQGLAALFARWTPFGGQTPFAGVRQVPGGTILRVDAQGQALVPYSGFPLPGIPAEISLDDAAAAARDLLHESVRLRLRSDVEVGVLLSGGLDSTIITQLMRMQAPELLRSFSITFADRQFDESRDQARVAEAFGVKHASLCVSGEDLSEAFQAALWHAEIPQFRTAFAPMFLLSRFIRERGIKVVLSGEGADEVFLGYNIFKEARLRAAWAGLEPEARRHQLSRLYPYLPHFSGANLRALEGRFARSSGGADDPLFSHALRFDNNRLALRLLNGGGGSGDALEEAAAALPGFASLSPARRAQWIEMHTLLQGYLLSSQGDRMTFAHGVESRCPFLSPAVVGFAAGLPETYLLSPEGDEKHLLKRAFREALPPEILAKPKQPYRAPMVGPFREEGEDGALRPWVEAHLTPAALRAIEPLDAEQAERFVAKVRATPPERLSPREDQAFVLLLSLSVLNRQLVLGEGGPAAAMPRPPLLQEVVLDG